jgi:protein-L-isoaspartate(D-aspartate) O-methyltransferase
MGVVRMADIAEHVAAFVQEMEGRGYLEPEWLHKALYAVPRHLFIERYCASREDERWVTVDPADPAEENLEAIYSDRGLMIRDVPDHSAASQPGLILAMLRHLEVEAGHMVLEIGTGSGWNAGLLAYRAGADELVHSIDLQPDLVEKARAHLCAAGFPGVCLRAGDGGYGWPERAPFDRIVATVGCPDIPPAWCAQLAEGGLLLVPFKISGVGDPLLRLEKRDGRLAGRFVGYSAFMTLQGAFGFEAEDWLLPPWEPEIEKMLQAEPEEVPVSEPVGVDGLFYLRLAGMRFRALLDENRKLGFPRRLLYCPEWNALLSPARKEATVEVYGNADLGEAVAAGLKAWIELGKPKFTEYRVELLTDGSADMGEGWFIRRPNVALRLFL